MAWIAAGLMLALAGMTGWVICLTVERDEQGEEMKPILFNTEMIRAILDGRKTVTRRPIKVRLRAEEAGFNIIVKVPTEEFCYLEIYDEWENETRRKGAPYCPGDILYVPEPWKCRGTFGDTGYMVGFKDGQTVTFKFPDKSHAWKWAKYANKLPEHWQSPYFMPREAARIFLRVTDVRVERLSDITEEKARKEGIDIRLPQWAKKKVYSYGLCRHIEKPYTNNVECFKEIWDSTIKPEDRDLYGWAANPWVWVISFERIEKPEAE